MDGADDVRAALGHLAERAVVQVQPPLGAGRGLLPGLPAHGSRLRPRPRLRPRLRFSLLSPQKGPGGIPGVLLSEGAVEVYGSSPARRADTTASPLVWAASLRMAERR
ncbi:hypothetical protein GCM10010508_36780 [Streptomyces naganishii JCM 4654]|uniref:Uncharacterized protein n=1 Tax=Streptomyces naganishii JCM 4654 TaxID=1306179 RepID=A0A918Y5C4_9ACTN|nr:hypothetical protein GCM10010508_36780 [Streptomyces naganishii JCM 4654]